MYFSIGFVAAALTAFSQVVSAGKGGWVTFINSTPYEWKLTYSHQYQMRWETTETVSSGTSREFYYEYRRNKDDGAEATYVLIGHPTNASFTIQARDSGEKRIEVQYRSGLYSLNNAENSLINLGWQHNGAVPFILVGDGIDTPFISSNPPVAWMQATFPSIGSKPIREICMPASHDAGASEITRSYFGVKHNVLTQSGNIYRQLINGARYFDIRPVVRKNKWYTAHLTVINKQTAFGGFTRRIKDIVLDINQFTTEYSGELIILDISHDLDRKDWKSLNPSQWQGLYRELLSIEDIWIAPLNFPEDITKMPISTFIQPGSKSAVIIRIPNGAPLPDFKLISRSLDLDELKSSEFNETSESEDDGLDIPDQATSTTTFTVDATDVPHPLKVYAQVMTKPTTEPKLIINKLPPNTTFAFFHEPRFPLTGSYSDTESPSFLTSDQLQKLNSRAHAVHRSTWTITQNPAKALDAATQKHSILAMSAMAHRALFANLWGNLTKEKYPNLIEVDDVWGSQFAALSIAINERFAKKVDKWEIGGKVGRLVGRERRILDMYKKDGSDSRGVVKNLKIDTLLERLGKFWEPDKMESGDVRGVIKHVVAE